MYLLYLLEFFLSLFLAHGAFPAEAGGELESRGGHASAEYGHAPGRHRRHWAQGAHRGRGQGPGPGEESHRGRRRLEAGVGGPPWSDEE